MRSKEIESNQAGVHDRLVEHVEKHLKYPFQKPIADYSLLAFEEAQAFVSAHNGRPVIFDSCCGVGDSTRALAIESPDSIVIGVDKSAKRLSAERKSETPENMLLLQADLNDFYRLMVEASWQIAQHKVYYPNPWPKAEHLMRRWHGGPIFPYMIKLCGALEIRSNWKLYLEEFAVALKVAGHNAAIAPIKPDVPISNHEAKYLDSGHQLWCLTADLS